MPQVTFLKSIDLRYQANGPLALKKLKERYANESKMKDSNPNTKNKKKIKEKEKDKESISRATLQVELARRANSLEKITRASEIIGLAFEDGICRTWQNSRMTHCQLTDVSLFSYKKPCLVEQKFKFQQRFDGFAKKIITSLRDGGADDLVQDSVISRITMTSVNNNNVPTYNNTCRGLCKFSNSRKLKNKDDCECLSTALKIQLNEFVYIIDSMIANIIAFETFPNFAPFSANLFDWLASYLYDENDTDNNLKLLALVLLMQLSYILTTRFPFMFKIDNNDGSNVHTFIVGKLLAITMRIVKSFRKEYNEANHIKNYLFRLTVTTLRSFLNTSISDYRSSRNKTMKDDEDAFYIAIGSLKYNENSLVLDLVYWLKVIVAIRDKSSSEYHNSNFIKTCDVNIGSAIVSDFLVITRNIILTWTSLLTENSETNSKFDEKFKVSLQELINISLLLSTISLKNYCYFYGDYEIKQKEFNMNEKQEKKMRSMLGTNPFYHSNLCLTNYIFSDVDTTGKCDEEIIVCLKSISVSFCCNTISKNSAISLLYGRKIIRRRLECHSVQLSFLQALLSLLLCINDGGICDDGSVLTFEKKKKEVFGTEAEVIDDIELLNTSEIIKLLLNNIIRDVTRTLSFHRQSQTIIHPGLLISRFILMNPYMSKKQVDEFLNAESADNDDEDDGMDDDDPHLKEFSSWQDTLTKEEMEKWDILDPKKLSFPHLLLFVSQNHIQNMEILEQFLLLFYQIVSSSHLAKVALIEVNLTEMIKRILDLQSDNVYIISLCQLILEAIDMDILD